MARIPFVATIIGLLCLGLAATLLLTTRSAEDSYQLSAARSHNQTLREQKAAYQRQVAAGSSAPILAAEAAKLGLIPAKDPARLVMSTDGSVQVVGTPKPAEGKPVPPLDRTPAPTPAPTAARPPAGSRPAAPVPATPNSSPQTPAPAPTTPQPVNDGRIQAREGQLTPVTVITQPSPGGRQ
ncbi:hypothetical protein [Rhodococcus sp. ABRD24]|uniref:hypothetical protein n=1 Tax=Rhodococcus sp. ABRD24 TaxID=2507582 RepID=UPI001F600D48|nr:hypothetical protein [Rhodococcus sp. ABRD24]